MCKKVNDFLNHFTFVILQGHCVHGSFLQSLQEKLNQIANVFSVGTLESELFRAYCAQSESLAESFARSAREEETNQKKKNIAIITRRCKIT